MAGRDIKNIWFGQARTDPKRRYRFVLLVGNPDPKSNTFIPIYYVKTAMKPKANVSQIEHSFLDYNFKYPGRVTWDNITVTLIDPVKPNMAKVFMQMLLDSGYEYPSTSNARAGISKAKATVALNTIRIQQIDDTGAPVESWDLKNAFIASVDFGGSLDYTSDEMNEITVEFAFDWAECAGTQGASDKTNYEDTVRTLFGT